MPWRRCCATTRPPAPSATGTCPRSPTAAWCRRPTTRAGSEWTFRAGPRSRRSNGPAWNCLRSATPRPTASRTRRHRTEPRAQRPSVRGAEHVRVGIVFALGAFGQAELQVQPLARVGRAQRGLAIDPAFLVQPVQALVEALDAFLQRLLHRLLDLVHLAAAQQ